MLIFITVNSQSQYCVFFRLQHAFFMHGQLENNK